MNPRTRLIVAIAAIALGIAIVVPFFLGGSQRGAGPSALVGTTAPVFSLADANGTASSLAAYRGKIVVMNLWASWCPPCRAEMPDLQRLAQKYSSKNVVVIGVNEGESRERASAFAQSLGIRFPIWIDDEQRYGRVYAALGMPTTVVIDRDGIVRKGFDGALTYGQMEAAVAPFAGGA